MYFAVVMAAAATFGPARPNNARGCAHIVRPGRRPSSQEVIIEALEDSAFDGSYAPSGTGKEGVQRAPRSRATRDVYGQIAIVRSSKNMAAGSRVVLIWWSPEDDCGPWYPTRALKLGKGDRAFLSLKPRPKSEWINGMPTFDMFFATYWEFYSPFAQDYVRKVRWVGEPLSVEELQGVIHKLPTDWDFDHDPWEAEANVLKWGEHNKSLAERYPLSEWMAEARESAAARSRSKIR